MARQPSGAAASADDRPATTGHNKPRSALTRADRTKLRLSHILRMRPIRAELESLKASVAAKRKELNTIRDAYANDGFSLAALDERLKNEGKSRKVVIAYETERHEVGEDLGQASYEQPDLFASIPEEVRDETYWSDLGFQYGIEGRALVKPEEMPDRFFQAFAKRYHAGQERLAWALAPDANPERTDTGVGAEPLAPAGDDEDENEDDGGDKTDPLLN